MVVPVSVVAGVPVAVVHEVDVILVRHGHVTAPLAVLVRMTFVRNVCVGRALVDVAVVDTVQMSVVHVVDVPAVR